MQMNKKLLPIAAACALFTPFFLCTSVLAAESLDFNVTVTAPSNTPSAVVGVVLDSVCPDLITTTGEDSANLRQVCNFITTATPAEIAAISDELSAKPNTASNSLATGTPSLGRPQGVGTRLSALRKSAKNTALFGFKSSIKKKRKTHYPVFNAQNSDDTGGLFSQRLSGFISLNNVSSEQIESQTEVGYESTSRGLLLGIDYRLLNRTFIGLATQYYNTSADLTDAGSSLDANQFGLTLYSTHFINDRWYLEGIINNSLQQLGLKRQIDITLGQQKIQSVATGDTSSQQLGFSLGTGYDIPLKFGFSSVASAGLHYSATNISAYSENDAGNLSLAIDSQEITSLTTSANIFLSRVFSTAFGVLIPQASATWIHETKDDQQNIAARFLSDSSNTNFQFSTPQADPNYFIVGLDLQMVLPQGRMAFIKYTNVRRLRNKVEYTLAAGFRMEF